MVTTKLARNLHVGDTFIDDRQGQLTVRLPIYRDPVAMTVLGVTDDGRAVYARGFDYEAEVAVVVTSAFGELE